MGDDFDDDGNGTMGDDVDHGGDGAASEDIDDDCDGAKVLLPSVRRHLRRRHDSVVALVVMASLPSPICRRLAIVKDDGDGVTGDDDYNDFDDATDFAIIVMALLPSLRWCRCRCRGAGVLPLSTMMATAQRATNQR
jgi:hypothetical protein